MDSFDLGRLTPFDFEAVCKDLAEDRFGVPFEIFAPGRDAGVDLRHLAAGASGAVIVQCKHWTTTRPSDLVRTMARHELPKINQLRPSRYILMTSARLGKGLKDRLFDTLQPHVRSPADIIGCDEIEAALRSNKAITRRHLRLWLGSAAVLDSMINKEILLRSQFLLEDIAQSVSTFVMNESFARAEQLLDDQHIAIVVGIPGIGKTTLANLLAAQHIAEGFELIEISEDIKEAYSLWDDTKAQIFYYDDFLGQTTVSTKMHKNEDQRLLKFLDQVHRAKNKRLVMTTREYILEQARTHYERLFTADFRPLTCVVDLADYVTARRAEILYNHVHASPLPTRTKHKFASAEIYDPIIRHANFNPRLVSLSLGAAAPRSDGPSTVAAFLLENLDRPRNLWEHIVQNQLDDWSVEVLETLFTFRNRLLLDDLRSHWKDYSQDPDEQRFTRALKILEGSMIKVEQEGGRTYIAFHNPSVRDYLTEYLQEQRDRLERLIETASLFEQIVEMSRQLPISADLAHLRDKVERAVAKTFGEVDDGIWFAACRVYYLIWLSGRWNSASLKSREQPAFEELVRLRRDGFIGAERNWFWSLLERTSSKSWTDLSDGSDARHAVIRSVDQMLGTWRSAREAEALLFRLSLAPHELREKVTDIVVGRAVDLLAAWYEETDLDGENLTLATDVFDYLSNFADESIEEEMDHLETLIENASADSKAVPVRRLGSTTEPADDDQYIAALMSSLLLS